MKNWLKFFSVSLVVLFCLLGALSLLFWFCLIPINSSPYLDLGNKYVYVEHDVCLLDSSGCLTLIVPDDVDDYMFDEKYVLAHQKPVFIRADYYWEYGKGYDKDSIEHIKRLCKDLQDCYWIIRKKDNFVFGPMSYNEYEQKCKVLGVKIKLNSSGG